MDLLIARCVRPVMIMEMPTLCYLRVYINEPNYILTVFAFPLLEEFKFIPHTLCEFILAILQNLL